MKLQKNLDITFPSSWPNGQCEGNLIKSECGKRVNNDKKPFLAIMQVCLAHTMNERIAGAIG